MASIEGVQPVGPKVTTRILYVEKEKTPEELEFDRLEAAGMMLSRCEILLVEKSEVLPGHNLPREIEPITAQNGSVAKAREPHIMGMGKKRVVYNKKRFGRWSKR